MEKTSPKVAVVTGGASGIGRAVALKLLEEGHQVVVVDKDVNAARSVAANNTPVDVEMVAQYLDVSNPKRVKSVFQKIFEKYGRMDILVNSAGITTPPVPLVEKSDADFKKVIDVHLMGTFYCMREGAAYMIKGKFGRIVNISSRAGIFGLYGKCNYSAAKAGIIGLSLTASKELYDKGITVNVIAPGAIRTPLAAPILRGKKHRRARLDMVVGEPMDIAHLVSFLILEESYLINGAVIMPDAGGHLWHGMDERFLSKYIEGKNY